MSRDGTSQADEDYSSFVPALGPTLTRESQLRLEYYERFGDVVQDQLNAIATRAAATVRELEREQAEMAAQNLRVRQETQALRSEAEALRREIAARRAEADAVRDESAREQTLVTEWLTRTREDIYELQEERDRSQASLDAMIRSLKREQAELGVQALRLREEVRAAERALAEKRAEADALVEEVESVRRERMPLAAEVARLREQVHGLTEECDRRREEAASIIAQAQAEASEILAGVEAGSGAIVTRALQDLQQIATPTGQATPSYDASQSGLGSPGMEDTSDRSGAWPVADQGGAYGAEPEYMSSRLLVRSDDRDAIHTVKAFVESLPEVEGSEIDWSGQGGPELIVSHAAARSLLGLLLASTGLEFTILESGSDALEIEVPSHEQ